MEEYARKAVQLDDGEAEAHWILADVYYVNKQFDDAIAEYDYTTENPFLVFSTKTGVSTGFHVTSGSIERFPTLDR